MKQKVAIRIVGDIEIGPSIAIEISPTDSHAVRLLCVLDARFGRDLFEGSVAPIAVEEVGFAGHLIWQFGECVLVYHPLRVGKMPWIAENIAGNVKIHKSVTVVVGPGGSDAKASAANARLCRDVGEFAAA